MKELSVSKEVKNENAARRGRNDRRNWLPERPQDYRPWLPEEKNEDNRKWLLPNEKGVPRRKR